MASARARVPIGQRSFFALLYFSEGAPIGYLWWAMPTRLRAAGMAVEEVAALTALLTLPWALKFLWAPAIDRLRGARWGHRAWITVSQAAMGLTLLPLGVAPLESLVGVATWLLLGHAVAAATQDVAIDALAIATVSESERGRITGWMQAGMLVGRAAFGGLALAAERWIGAQAVALALVVCVLFTLSAVWTYGGARPSALGRTRTPAPFLRTLRRALARRTTWVGLGVAVAAGAGFEAVGGLMGPYLLDRGALQEEVGWFFAIPVVACMIAGGLLGGWAADRLGHRRVVGASVALIAALVAALIVGDGVFAARGWALMALAAPIYFGAGCLTASSYALFMDLTDPAIGGTQFSAFMSGTNLCEVMAVAMAGRIAGGPGYGWAFGAGAALSMAALLLLPWTVGRARRGGGTAESPVAG